LVERSSNYVIRTYRSGDENVLPALFNGVFSAHAGFVPRTSEYWTWCCLNRPTVEKNGICILEKAGEIVGYAVVAVESKNGKIRADVLELCYTREEGETAARILVSWIAEYARSRKVDQISLDAPKEDEILRKIVLENGFGEFPHVQSLMTILDYCQLVHEIVKLRKSRLDGLDEIFQISISGSQTSRSYSFWVQTDENDITVSAGTSQASSVRIRTDTKTFTACLFGLMNPLSAVLRTRIETQPFWKFRKVAKLFSALRLSDPWFVPKGDFG